MKRDKKLIRKILENVRDNEDASCTLKPSDYEVYSPEKLQHHIEICEQAGFIATADAGYDPYSVLITLTWDGYNALDNWTGC